MTEPTDEDQEAAREWTRQWADEACAQPGADILAIDRAEGIVRNAHAHGLAEGNERLKRLQKNLAISLKQALAERDEEHANAVRLLKVADSYEVQRDEARANLAEASRVWDGPETSDWIDGVRKEAAHQVARWGVNHDKGKNPEDWFWLIGYLAGKALAAFKAGDIEKAKHHTISSGAAMLNWHASMMGVASQLRPGIDSEE